MAPSLLKNFINPIIENRRNILIIFCVLLILVTVASSKKISSNPIASKILNKGILGIFLFNDVTAVLGFITLIVTIIAIIKLIKK